MSRATKAIFGDFQTPLELARDVARHAASVCGPVATVVEPTCGVGNFLLASIDTFGTSTSYYGFDINDDYVRRARAATGRENCPTVRIECKDFYQMDWPTFFRRLPDGLLVIGNPPWITNAALGAMGANNLPEKTNFQGHSGFAAKTGKSNFDISEWMLIKLLQSLQGRVATVVMLCKTATARKVLRHAWKNEFDVGCSSLHSIDAARHFGVSVDACLFITHTAVSIPDRRATLYRDLSFDAPDQSFGIASGEIVSDLDAFTELQDLDGLEYRRWRSGVKHDAAKVMELEACSSGYRNGFGETWDLEGDYIYPLLKSSDLANDRLTPRKFVLLTQKRVSDDTGAIQAVAPNTWRYLMTHAEALDRRGSSIYTNRSRFAVFGVGSYTFSAWKVAISGLYRNLHFRTIGSYHGRPIVLDDTCYFIPCESREEADFFAGLLNSDIARRFLKSLAFFDSKRAVTIDVLRRVDVKKLAERLGKGKEASDYLVSASFEEGPQQLLVF